MRRRRLPRWRCPTCGVSVELAIEAAAVRCWRCRQPMRQVAGEVEQGRLELEAPKGS